MSHLMQVVLMRAQLGRLRQALEARHHEDGGRDWAESIRWPQPLLNDAFIC